MASKYYWLRLKRDFFKRHDIRIIEEMPNGKDYILFYLKLMVESVDHEGELRFSETIPYNEQMLATITNTNVDIVRSAMKVFTELELIELLDDDTIYMREVEKLIGAETDEHVREQGRIRQQKYRDRLKGLQDKSNEALHNVTVTLHRNAEKEIEIDKDIDKKHSARMVHPSLEEVREYCIERNNNIDPQHFIDYYESNGWKVGKNPMKDWKATVRSWEGRNKKVVKGSNFDQRTDDLDARMLEKVRLEML